jgi:vacuolar-type H+-ATPase subunit D/Vma8
MWTLEKIVKKMLEMENTIKEMKNAIDRLTTWLETAKKRINELEYISVEFSQLKYEEKYFKKWR